MTDAAHDRQFGTLMPAATPAGRAFAPTFGRFSQRPVAIGVAGVVVLSGLGWIVLGLTAAAVPDGQLATALRETICWPTFGRNSHFEPASIAAGEFGLIASMWCAMVLAMMLPTAGPMIVSYAEIADTAARQGEAIVSPLVLMSGYAAIWLGFAFAVSIFQMLLMRADLLDPMLAGAGPLAAGVIFLAAGCYQFSALKHACVRRCQRPFPFFFANWTDQTAGVFRLGLRLGFYCLGCCWAMMGLMFAVGAMNVVWMAALGLVMGFEKIATTPRFSRAIGVVLIAAGVTYIVAGSSM